MVTAMKEVSDRFRSLVMDETRVGIAISEDIEVDIHACRSAFCFVFHQGLWRLCRPPQSQTCQGAEPI